MLTVNKKIGYFNYQALLNVLFVLCLVSILVTRVLLFFHINLDFIDSDQPFMWIGAKDYSEGNFFEPRFYGQNYNTFFESLVAVPLLWAGMPVYYAVPTATHFLFLFPFLFTASYLFTNKKKENGLLVLVVLLCMPSGYDILNSLPRGFVTGVFFSSFFVISMVNPMRRVALIINLLMVLLGYFVNANSVLVTVPFVFYMFLHHYRNAFFYCLLPGLALVFFGLYWLFDGFYHHNPYYVVYGFQHQFSIRSLVQNLMHLDEAFAHISFFTNGNCLTLLAAIGATGYFVFKRDLKLFMTFVVFILVILFSFLSTKTRDGSFWPYYSYSRMYLGIPIMLYLFTGQLVISNKTFVMLFVSMGLFFSTYKNVFINQEVTFHMQQKLWVGVHVVSLKQVLDAVGFYQDACKKQGVGHLIISNAHWLNTFLNYGGPAISSDFPSTEESNSERRYRVREGNKHKVFRQFVLLAADYNLDKLLQNQNDFEVQRLDDFGLMLIKNNRIENDEFMRRVREHDGR